MRFCFVVFGCDELCGFIFVDEGSFLYEGGFVCCVIGDCIVGVILSGRFELFFWDFLESFGCLFDCLFGWVMELKWWLLEVCCNEGFVNGDWCCKVRLFLCRRFVLV